MSPFFEMELQKQAWTGVCVFLYPPRRPLSWSWHFRKRTPEVFPEGFKERLWVKTGPRKSVEKKSASVHCLRSKMTSLGGKKELSAQASWGYELFSLLHTDCKNWIPGFFPSGLGFQVGNKTAELIQLIISIPASGFRVRAPVHLSIFGCSRVEKAAYEHIWWYIYSYEPLTILVLIG